MDILALLVILMAVVLIAWMIVSYMEIEKLKTTVYGEENKKEVIKPVWGVDFWSGESITPPQQKISGILAELYKHPPILEFENRVTGETIKQLDKNKIYYLCHPCTSGGRTIEENKYREEYLYQRIISHNQGVKIIRPLVIIPDGMEHNEAMKRCFDLIDASHIIILPMGWQNSTGCSMENEYSIKTGTGRIFISAS